MNEACADQGRCGVGNVAVRHGKGGGRWRVLRCSTCKAEFSERKCSALWGTRMSPERVEAIASHLKKGGGIRSTARLVGASKTGVTSVAMRIGLHASALHDPQVRGVVVREAQFDEKWSFVGKKQKNCDDSKAEDAEAGDQWDPTAIDVESRFVVAGVVAKRDCHALTDVVREFADRTGGAPPPLITTDDCRAYSGVLMNQYGATIVPPPTGRSGRPRNAYKRWPSGSAYATVNKTYKKGTVVEVQPKLVFGTNEGLAAALAASPVSATINTSFVERQHGTDRRYNARKARKT